MNGISVVLSTYNGFSRGYLKEAIDSVLNQKFEHFELIIVDDGSQDRTEELCLSYEKCPHVKYFKKKNGGPASARNFGIKASNFDYITFLDDDDYFKETMLIETWNYLKEKNARMVYCRTEEINIKKTHRQSIFQKHEGNIFKQLLYGNFITTSAVLIEKKLLEEVKLFDEELHYSEDLDLWLKIAKKNDIFALDKILVCRRIHDNRLSSHFDKMYINHLKVIEKNLKENESVKKETNSILKNFYLNHASIYLGNHCYKQYRHVYLEAKKLGYLSFLWKIKYFLSYFPWFFKLSYFLYRATFKNIKEGCK